MNAKAMLLLVVILTGCGCGSTQRWLVPAMTATAMTLTACDYRQTVSFSDHGRWDTPAMPDGRVVESNPVLGKTPSFAFLTVAAGASEAAVLTTGLARVPAWLKYTILGAVIAVETAAITNNVNLDHAAGLCGDRWH